MELKFKGQFNRDIDINNLKLLKAIGDVILNIKNAKSPSQIHRLKKLRNYKTHYRIKIDDDYRIGIIIRGKSVWLA